MMLRAPKSHIVASAAFRLLKAIHFQLPLKGKRMKLYLSKGDAPKSLAAARICHGAPVLAPAASRTHPPASTRQAVATVSPLPPPRPPRGWGLVTLTVLALDSTVVPRTGLGSHVLI